jgi:AhpD family alkylhydroperoxidase
MEERIEYANVAPDGVKAMTGLERYLGACGLEKKLLDLVKLRASQINGCAYCVDMHWKDLRADGESEQRLYSLDAWRETSFYTDRECAALDWTEAVTLLTEGHVPDELYDRVRRQFSEKEMVDLTLAVVAINGWNRLCISFRKVAGTYQPSAARAVNKNSS